MEKPSEEKLSESTSPDPLFRTVEFSKKQLEAIFDHLEPMCLVGTDMHIIRINKSMASFLNTDFKNCIGKHLKNVFYEWDHTLLSNNVDLVLSSRRSIQINDYSLVERGKKGWYEITFYPVSNEEKKVDECVIYFKNITELFLTKKILLQQYKKLEEQQMMVENKNALLIETQNTLDLKHQAIMDELNVAREVQQGLMPNVLPKIPGIEFFSSYEPISQVGGDIYDILKLDSQHIGVFIGDVSGHGMAAAFVGAMVKMALIDHADKQHSPKGLFEVLNKNLIKHLKSGHYLTAFYGILNTSDYTFTYSKASHPHPILVRDTGEALELETGGMFLGLMDEPQYEEKKIQLRAGDRLYLFTDGYFEIKSREGNHYMYNNFTQLISSINHLPKAECHQKLTEKLSQYTGHKELEDDRTFLIMEIVEPSKSDRLPLLSHFSQSDNVIIRSFSSEEEFDKIFKEFEIYVKDFVDSEEARQHIIISSIELVNNALEHGNKNDPEKVVYLAYASNGKEIKITVRDEGKGFNPQALEDPRSDGKNQLERGRGIFIVKSYMDEVYFNGSGNTITIVKSLS